MDSRMASRPTARRRTANAGIDTPKDGRISPLAEPLTLPCGAIVGNRFYKSAMNEALAGRDCAPTERHVHLYRTWAEEIGRAHV